MRIGDYYLFLNGTIGVITKIRYHPTFESRPGSRVSCMVMGNGIVTLRKASPDKGRIYTAKTTTERMKKASKFSRAEVLRVLIDV